MARHIFAGDSVWKTDSTPYANQPFTLWDDLTAGTQVTDVKSSDGVSDITLQTDSLGRRPVLRGPDGVKTLFCDTGAGIRFPMIGIDALEFVLENYDALASVVAGLVAAGPGSGGGLPAGTTLEQIPNGPTRLAITAAQVTKLDGIAAGATALTLGVTATSAKRGDYSPLPADIGAVRNMGGFARVWGVTGSATVKPTAAQGAVDGDWLVVDGS